MKPPYKKGKYYYIINFCGGGLSPRFVEVERAKYLGYHSPSKDSYPTMLFGENRKSPSHFPYYKSEPFNPKISGMTIAATPLEVKKIVEAHKKVIRKEIKDFIKRNNEVVKDCRNHLKNL